MSIPTVKAFLTETGVRRWVTDQGVSVRGYLFYQGTYLANQDLCQAVAQLPDPDAFADFLRAANGNFAIIRHTPSGIWASVDRLRSIPLAFKVGPDPWITDDLAAYLGGEGWALHAEHAQQFLHLGYILGQGTLVQDVDDLPSGHLVVMDGNGIAEIRQWHSHSHTSDPVPVADPAAAITAFSDRMISRAIESIKGRQIVIPLSGGYDSRYIAALVRKAGYENVVCYSYGRPESHEVKVAQTVAERLKFKWIFIDYDMDAWASYITDTIFHDFASNLTSLPLCQDYPAIKHLKDNNLIEPNAVIFPGYCGDVLGGSFIPDEMVNGQSELRQKKGIPDFLLNRHFVLQGGVPDRQVYHDVLEPHIAYQDPTERGFIATVEEFATRNRLSKFVINGVRVFEYFGYEWRLPLWDNEICEFWYSIDQQQRFENKLYTEVLMETLFAQFDIAIPKKGIVGLKNKILTNRASRIAYLYARPLVKTLAKPFVNKKAIIDFNGFSQLEQMFDEQTTLKKPRTSLNINSYYTRWYLTKLHKDFDPDII